MLPVFAMLVFGAFSTGTAYNQKASLAQAAREGARYGATLPSDQTSFVAPATSWATAVQQVVVGRSLGELTAAQVCVALVNSSPPAAIDANHIVGASGGTNCFDDGSLDTGKRVQVLVRRTGKIDAVLFSMNLNLTSRATVRFEAAS